MSWWCRMSSLWWTQGFLKSKLSPRLCHTHINKVRRGRKPSKLLSYFLQWSHRTERRRSSPLFLLDLRRGRMLSRSRFSTSASHRVLSSILSLYPPLVGIQGSILSVFALLIWLILQFWLGDCYDWYRRWSSVDSDSNSERTHGMALEKWLAWLWKPRIRTCAW